MKILNVIIVLILLIQPSSFATEENKSQGILYKIKRGRTPNELAAYVVGITRYSIQDKKYLSGDDLRDLYILIVLPS